MSVELPGDLGDVPPQELSAGIESTEIRRTAPIAHGAGISYVLDDDVDAYQALRQAWRDQIGEPGEKVALEANPDFLPAGNYVWLFYSSRWKAGKKNARGTFKKWYKYHITLRRVVRDEHGEIDELHKPATSCNVVVEPQAEGLEYEDGNDVDLPYGVGTRLQVQTTYVERGSKAVTRGIGALEDVLAATDQDANLADVGNLKRPSVRIWKLETYLRFNVERKHAAVSTLQKSSNLIDVGGGADIDEFRQRQQEGWLEARVSSDRWDRLGLEPAETTVVDDGEEVRVGYDRELKVYQAQDWADRDRDDPLAHPKIEASIDGGRNPHIDEWGDVLDRLRECVLSHAEWAGIEDDDLVADDYFKPSTQPTITVSHPEGRREDLRAYYNRFEPVIYSEAIKAQTDAVYDILGVIVERHGATYDTLEAATGFSRSNLQYHVGKLKDLGLLTTVGNPAIVCFDAEYLYEQVEEILESQLAPHFDEETLAARRRGRDDRARERREARENGEANGTDLPDDSVDDVDQDADDQDDGDRDTWVYLSEYAGSLLDLEHEIEHPEKPRTRKDVRVRLIDDG